MGCCSEQSSKAVSGGEGLLETGNYVYVWEDWVTIICRHLQHTLDKDVPLNARYVWGRRVCDV